MQKSESGSAHVIIIAILSVALIGAVGILFWQNFINKPTEKASTDTAMVAKADSKQAVSESPQATANNPNEGYLVLNDWGVRFKPTSSVKISYELKNDGHWNGDYWFTTDTLKNLGGYCDVDGGIPLVRSTERYIEKNSPPTPLNNEQKIGNYYYYYYTPQATCSDDDHYNQEPAEYRAIKDLLATIEAKK
jgi:hypothetical protein